MTRSNGSPFAPHTAADRKTMLDSVGVDTEADLFDIPETVAFDGEFTIPARSEQEIRAELRQLFARNQNLTEFLGRGHYSHYVPSIVGHLSDRAEYLTSYTQYQPEITQGFLQVLFEYQSMLVELTGLPVANCSMYDAATGLAEAALLADRVRQTSGKTILVPEFLREGKRSVLENYVAGAGLTVESFPLSDGTVDTATLAEVAGDETVMIYAENPTVRGTIEDELRDIGEIAADNEALFCLGSDLVALSLLQEPASVGADIVVGEADVLGLPTSYGMGLGIFATRETFLRQVPGRLVGVSEDADDRRSYTLTLQTREQHIRKERATSNICTNQAWVALRTAMHIASLGPDGLVSLAEDCVRDATELAARVDALDGYQAPIYDQHHFREFVVRSDQPAEAVTEALETDGIAVHAIDDHLLQCCITETNRHAADQLIAALRRAA